MNPFQRLGVKISNWWRGEPQDSGGVVTLNSPSFLERIGLKRKGDGHIKAALKKTESVYDTNDILEHG